MTTRDDAVLRRWQDFLERAAKSWLEADPSGDAWPGGPAGEDVLAAVEDHLGQPLPLDYRAFLAAGGGGCRLGHLAGPLLPADEVGWARDVTPDLAQSWLDGLRVFGGWPDSDEPDPLALSEHEHLVYGAGQHPLAFHAAYLAGLLQVGRFAEVTYLLNPAVRTAAGEWEAWALGGAYSGARRFPSFEAMAEHEHENDRLLFPDRAEEDAIARAGLPHPAGFAHGSELWVGQTLRRQSLTSQSGVHTLAHQDDGNLVLYRYSDGSPQWSAGTAGTQPGYLALEEDGNLRLRDADLVTVWESDTSGLPVDRLSVDDGGRLHLLDHTGAVVWSTER